MAREKILVIDDDKDILQSMKNFLDLGDYVFLGARDGKEGLHKALTEKPALIFLDLVMPGMSGWDVINALREEKCDIPVIIITAYGSEEIASKAFSLRVRDYIIKPPTGQEVLTVIDRALTERRLEAERERLTQQVLQTNKQLEQRIKELGVLYKVGQSVTSLLNLEKLLIRIVEAAIYLTEAERGGLFLVAARTRELYFGAARGFSREFERSLRLEVEDSLLGQVIKTGRPLVVHCGSDEEKIKIANGYLVKSLLGVPLRVKGDIIGALCVDNITTDKAFTDSNAYLLSALADYAAIAVENARLYDEVRRSAARLEQEVEERTREFQMAYEELQEAQEQMLAAKRWGVDEELLSELNARAQEQMLAAERWTVLGKAAANLAHRINNTAGLIPVVTQDLKELLADVALEEERRQEIDADLQRVERNTRFTLQMADALFKPFEALPTEECDVNALLEESISVANVPEDVALTTKYADGLPRVFASRLLADVFVELITNALKAMPDGGELEIGSRLGEEGWVEVWVSDTGHGIPPESQGKIFDLFFTTSEDSLGFGLWWVKTFLLQQGATIDVESEAGKGTTFTVRLPVKGPQAAVE